MQLSENTITGNVLEIRMILNQQVKMDKNFSNSVLNENKKSHDMGTKT